jgi:hypothetical protein
MPEGLISQNDLRIDWGRSGSFPPRNLMLRLRYRAGGLLHRRSLALSFRAAMLLRTRQTSNSLTRKMMRARRR